MSDPYAYETYEPTYAEDALNVSIADLKAQLATVPGIENLTMRQEGGQQVFSVGGQFVTLGPLASLAEIEAALRAAPPLGAAPAPTPGAAPVTTAPAAATPAPTALSPLGFVPGSISGIFGSLRAAQAALVKDMQSTAAEAVAVLDAGRQMHTGLKNDVEAMKADLHGLTNFPPAV